MTVHPPMPYRDYAALPGLRSSHLRQLAESPLHYARPKPRKGDAVELRLIHALALEGEEAASRAFVAHDGTRRGKVYETLRDANPDRDVATLPEWSRARACAAALRVHPRNGELLRAAQPEVTVTWLRADGRACKARLDALVIGRGLRSADDFAWIVDLKGYGSTAPHHVARQAGKLGAHLQAAHYIEGLREGYGWHGPVRYSLAVYETSEPYDCERFDLTEEAIESATAARELLIARLAECERSGIWPGRHTEAQQLHPPPTYTDDLDLTDIPEEDA